ncbi:hypothetical protein M071_3594 [Bacteroides fragilis str. Ds-233]|nr:hypothetical protein M071_3594 [Bacteroides fragilis str. Ds-233]
MEIKDGHLKKTSQNIWQFKINPLPLHPLFETKQNLKRRVL